LVENELKREDVLDFLYSLNCRAMIGLNVSNGHKHAVIFNGIEDENFIFMNNKRRNSQEPKFYRFNANELLDRTDKTVYISYLDKGSQGIKIDLFPEIKKSQFHLQEYKD